jgi:hypothetical protein
MSLSVLTYPTQTITGTNYAYTAADSGIITYRTNAGKPMFDTIPDPSSVRGCYFPIGNNDSSAALIVNPALNATTINGVLSQLTINPQNGAVLQPQSNNSPSNYSLNPSTLPVQFAFTGSPAPTPPSGSGALLNVSGVATLAAQQWQSLNSGTLVIDATGGSVNQPMPAWNIIPNNYTLTLIKKSTDVTSNAITPTIASGSFSPSAPSLTIAGSGTVLSFDIVNQIVYEVV